MFFLLFLVYPITKFVINQGKLEVKVWIVGRNSTYIFKTRQPELKYAPLNYCLTRSSGNHHHHQTQEPQQPPTNLKHLLSTTHQPLNHPPPNLHAILPADRLILHSLQPRTLGDAFGGRVSNLEGVAPRSAGVALVDGAPHLQKNQRRSHRIKVR